MINSEQITTRLKAADRQLFFVLFDGTAHQHLALQAKELDLRSTGTFDEDFIGGGVGVYINLYGFRNSAAESSAEFIVTQATFWFFRWFPRAEDRGRRSLAAANAQAPS